MTTEPTPRARRYAKPVVVADRLELLVGPTSGVVHLPRHLKWSGSAHYDLDQPGRIGDMYRTVLNEAASVDDLHAYLERETVKRLWPDMWLPTPVQQFWEERFPELAAPRHSQVA